MHWQPVLRCVLLWILTVCGVILLLLYLPTDLERRLVYALRYFISWLKYKLILT